MGTLNTNFIKTVQRNLNDCSNPLQLRIYMKRYQDYTFSDDIIKLFEERISFFEDQYKGDSYFSSILNDIKDEFEVEMMIAKACGGKNLIDPNNPHHPKIKKALLHDIKVDFVSADTWFECPFERDTLRDVFQMTNGNKIDICRILGLTNGQLNDKINLYGIKDELNEIRRKYRFNGSRK